MYHGDNVHKLPYEMSVRSTTFTAYCMRVMLACVKIGSTSVLDILFSN